MSLDYFQSLLPRLVREQTQHVKSTDIDRVIASAVQQYSQDAPRQVVADFTWNTAGYRSATVPTSCSIDSTVLQAEYPIGQQPPSLVNMALLISADPLGLMCDRSLPAGAVVRITFTCPHVLVAGTSPQDTIPAKHRDAVANYAAHLLCRELATLYSAERESSIAADGSNTESRARNYAARAREFRAAYYAGIGVADPMGSGSGGGNSGTSSASAAGAVVSWGSRARPSWRTQDVGLGQVDG